ELSLGAVPIDSIPEATGEGTDILGAVRSALRRYRSKNVVSVVLLSDGRVSRGRVTSSGGISVPVYAVGFGDTLESADISIEDVFYERVTYAGTATTIEVVIRATGFKGSTIEVRLIENGSVKENQTLKVREGSEELSAAFSYTPEGEGDHLLVIEALPLVGEERKENNEESIGIKVLKDRICFLYIDQFADWNMTFLRDLVKCSRRLDIETVTYVPKRGFVMIPGGREWNFPVSSSELGHYDLVVIADDTRLFVIPSNVEVLEEYVENGGALLFLADENSPVRNNSSLMLLESVLPVRLSGSARVKTGEYYVRIGPGERENPLAAVLAEGGRLEAIPPLLAAISGLEVTAGARVPLVLDDGDTKGPFLAVQRQGEGISAVVWGFPLWRWKLAGEEGVEAYDLFFGGLVQYLAEGADLPGLDLDSDRSVYRAGDRIGLSVFLRDTRFLESLRGEVLLKGNSREPLVRTFLFEPDSRRNGYFKADLNPLPSGDYRIKVSEVRISGSGMTGEVEISVLPVSVEFLKTSRDVSFLRHIAVISGGRMLGEAGLSLLPERMRLNEDEIERREVKSMRQSFLLFLVVVLFFAIEWILRKKWGLV
ncbi:MAG: hypothetical protein KAX38_01700, partial [Candidatus Krumholzibacteria bacterium]|nr:hypothetical protein [Candidatus Krumholzibacteria bacterium]